MRDDRVEGEVFGERLQSPEAQGSVQCLLPEAQARLLASSEPRRAGSRGSRIRRWRSRSSSRCAAAGGAGAAHAPPGAGAARGRRRARRPAGQGEAPPLRLLVAGDSSAAGVGVAHQDQAVVGHLVRTLQAQPAPGRSHWRLARPHRPDDARACTSCCDADARRRAADVAVVVTGVNDVDRPGAAAPRPARTAPRSPTGCSARGWRATSSSPRCRRCTSSRSCREPLRGVMGADARRHDDALARWAATRSDVSQCRRSPSS